MEKLNVNKKNNMGAQQRQIRIFATERHIKDLNYSCFVPSSFVTRSLCTQPSFISFFCSRFAGRYTEKYIIMINMYRKVQYIIHKSKRNN